MNAVHACAVNERAGMVHRVIQLLHQPACLEQQSSAISGEMLDKTDDYHNSEWTNSNKKVSLNTLLYLR
jgi:hypothetical protein